MNVTGFLAILLFSSWIFCFSFQYPFILKRIKQSEIFSVTSNTQSSQNVNLFQRAIQYRFPSSIPYNNFNNSDVKSDEYFAESILREYQFLKTRVEKLERSLNSWSSSATTSSSSLTASTKVKGSMESFLDAIATPTIEINSKTIEIVSIITCFTFGALIGASLLDRLWLLGGLFGAYWASQTVSQDTKSGRFLRRLSTQLSFHIKELQEKYNQIIIFYRTGRLAYYSSKIWEQYDMKYQITEKFLQMKENAKKKAEKAFQFSSDVKFYDPMKDIWKVLVETQQQQFAIRSKQWIEKARDISKTLYVDSEKAFQQLFLFPTTSTTTNTNSNTDEHWSHFFSFPRSISSSWWTKKKIPSNNHNNKSSFKSRSFQQEYVNNSWLRLKEIEKKFRWDGIIPRINLILQNAVNILLDRPLVSYQDQLQRNPLTRSYNPNFFIWPFRSSSISSKKNQSGKNYYGFSPFQQQQRRSFSSSIVDGQNTLANYTIVQKIIALLVLGMSIELMKQILKTGLRFVLK
jgi:hypothetical protein